MLYIHTVKTTNYKETTKNYKEIVAYSSENSLGQVGHSGSGEGGIGGLLASVSKSVVGV
jgi:hypothetical protein